MSKHKEPLKQEKEYWAHKVQTNPLPLWTEAFEYAHQYAIDDTVDLIKGRIDKLEKSLEVLENHEDEFFEREVRIDELKTLVLALGGKP